MLFTLQLNLEDCVESLSKLEKRWPRDVASLPIFIGLEHGAHSSTTFALPTTAFLVSLPLSIILKEGGTPSIAVGLPPEVREDIFAIYGYCFDHDAAAVETFREQLKKILAAEWTTIEKVGFGELLFSLATAMKERKEGFFMNIARATQIICSGYQGWKSKKVAEFCQ